MLGVPVGLKTGRICRMEVDTVKKRKVLALLLFSGLLQRRRNFDPRPVLVAFVMDRVALG